MADPPVAATLQGQAASLRAVAPPSLFHTRGHQDDGSDAALFVFGPSPFNQSLTWAQAQALAGPVEDPRAARYRQFGMRRWLVTQRDAVTLDGTACNKVRCSPCFVQSLARKAATNFAVAERRLTPVCMWVHVGANLPCMPFAEALPHPCTQIGFNRQAYQRLNSSTNACTRPLGSCLDNQLADLATMDALNGLRKLFNDGLPTYNFANYSAALPVVVQAPSLNWTGQTLALRYPWDPTPPLLSTLEVAVDASELVYVQRQYGAVGSARVCVFGALL